MDGLGSLGKDYNGAQLVVRAYQYANCQNRSINNVRKCQNIVKQKPAKKPRYFPIVDGLGR